MRGSTLGRGTCGAAARSRSGGAGVARADRRSSSGRHPDDAGVADLGSCSPTCAHDRCRPRRRGHDRGQPRHGRRGDVRRLLDAGYERLSMGAQSFDAAVLASLERIHRPESVRRAFSAARDAGVRNVNVDLIYGANGESVDSWARTLSRRGPRARSRLGVRADDRAATPLGRKVAAGDRARPRSRPSGRHVRARVRAARRCRVRPLRGVQLGPARARVPCTTSATGSAGPTSGWAPARTRREGRRWWNLPRPRRTRAGRGGLSAARGRGDPCPTTTPSRTCSSGCERSRAIPAAGSTGSCRMCSSTPGCSPIDDGRRGDRARDDALERTRLRPDRLRSLALGGEC